MNKAAIIPREKLDFGLDTDIPKYWLDNDRFKTRFFDAMSVTFPEGERFFITTIRPYRDQITDETLLDDIQKFIRQEGQHGMAHTAYNNRLITQGIDVGYLEAVQRKIISHFSRMPQDIQLALTAASEHATAIMCHGFIEHADLMQNADYRMRALYAWHSMEEVEHKAVAYDVMQKVAKTAYWKRVLTWAIFSITFPIQVFSIMNYMFKKDGFSFFERCKLFAKGIPWLYGPKNGIFPPILGHYFSYFKPSFHPWDHGTLTSYEKWLASYEQDGDPIKASQMIHPQWM